MYVIVFVSGIVFCGVRAYTFTCLFLFMMCLFISSMFVVFDI